MIINAAEAVEDLEDEALGAEGILGEVEVGAALKCIRRFVLIAGANVKFLLSRLMASPFFAAIVLRGAGIPVVGIVEERVERILDDLILEVNKCMK
jgi:hypothetical protein